MTVHRNLEGLLSVNRGVNSLKGFSNIVWRTRAFGILLKVLKFINYITKSTFTTGFQHLTPGVFSIIGDKTADFNYYKFNNYLKYEVDWL
jgi:hypothetical protein